MDVMLRNYLSFLLRIWRVGQNGQNAWRASLENPHTGERRSFANLKALLDFLREQTQETDSIESDQGKNDASD
jgi:hypothetical protein